MKNQKTKADSKINMSDLEQILQVGNVVSQACKKLAIQAAECIINLWDPSRRTFWRSTEHRSRDEGSDKGIQFFPTVTFRCVDALLSYMTDFPDWCPGSIRSVLIDSCVPSLLSLTVETLSSSLGGASTTKKLHPFTLSLYIVVLSKISSLNCLAATQRDGVQVALKKATLLLLEQIDQDNGKLRVEPWTVHPFLLFHVSRSLRSHWQILRLTGTEQELGEKINNRLQKINIDVRAITEFLLSRHELGILNPSESVALAFCAAALADSQLSSDEGHMRRSIIVCANEQDASGGWPLGRVVGRDKDLEGVSLEISSFEVAWAISYTILKLIDQRRTGPIERSIDEMVERLELTLRYTETSVVQVPGERLPKRGWCTDHPYGIPIIESWTSATTLQFSMGLFDLIEQTLRQSIATSFRAFDPREESWPPWLQWKNYLIENEPQSDRPILQYLDKYIVKTICNSPRKLPSANDRNVSVLLFGPPGTQKTSIAKAVADGLDWPIILLSPGQFIEQGLEFIEAQSGLVFARLLSLSRAVIVFDECDELFRSRVPSPQIEQVRSITAFVTASMLPKIQQLHDHARVVFFICTNHFESLDKAIIRGGRIDHIIGIGPPDNEARKRILARELRNHMNITYIQDAIDEASVHAERFTRTDLLRVTHLLCAKGNFTNPGVARKSARQIVDKLKGSLTIDLSEFEQFNKFNKEYSQPWLEGGDD